MLLAYQYISTEVAKNIIFKFLSLNSDCHILPKNFLDRVMIITALLLIYSISNVMAGDVGIYPKAFKGSPTQMVYLDSQVVLIQEYNIINPAVWSIKI
jgi:hypothetical protein